MHVVSDDLIAPWFPDGIDSLWFHDVWFGEDHWGHKLVSFEVRHHHRHVHYEFDSQWSRGWSSELNDLDHKPMIFEHFPLVQHVPHGFDFRLSHDVWFEEDHWDHRLVFFERRALYPSNMSSVSLIFSCPVRSWSELND